MLPNPTSERDNLSRFQFLNGLLWSKSIESGKLIGLQLKKQLKSNNDNQNNLFIENIKKQKQNEVTRRKYRHT